MRKHVTFIAELAIYLGHIAVVRSIFHFRKLFISQLAFAERAQKLYSADSP